MSNVKEVRLGRLFQRRKVLGHIDEPMLSVYRDHGVVLKGELTNHNQTAEDRSIYQLVEPGWFVVNRMKAWQGSVGVSTHRGIVSGHYICFEPHHGEVDRYLHYLLRSPAVRTHFESISRGVRPGQIEIDNDELAATRLLLPSAREQRRVADFLDDRVARIDQIITARRHQTDTLREFCDRTVVDTLLGNDFSQLAQGPWFVGAMGTHSLRLGLAWSVIDCKHRTPNYTEAGYPVISPGDVTAGRLDLSVAHRFVDHTDYLDLADDLRRCRRGDLVYSRNASAGTAAFVDTAEPFTMGQDVCRITSSDQDQLYLAYCLNYLVEPQLDAARVGSTFTRINIDQIKALVIPMRSLSDQQRVALACDRIATDFENAESGLATATKLLTEYKQSLITAAVTGELDVTTAGSGIPG